MWWCMTICPAAPSLFMPMLMPSAETAFLMAIASFFIVGIKLDKSSSGISYKFLRCSFGTKSVCPGFIGRASKKASEESSS